MDYNKKVEAMKALDIIQGAVNETLTNTIIYPQVRVLRALSTLRKLLPEILSLESK